MSKKFYIALLFLICFVGNIYAQSVPALMLRARRATDSSYKIRLLTQVLQQEPDNATALHYRADAYRDMEKTELALQDYTRAIQLTPKDPFRYYARALMYMDMEKYTLAAADLTKAIALKKNYADFYFYRAQAQMALEKYTSAISDYQKYVAKKPKTIQIALALADGYIKTYKYAQAEEELDFLEQENPDMPEIYFYRGRILQNQGNLDEAVSFYSKAINRNPDFAEAYRYRANAFKDMGELAASAEDYSSLIALEPEPIFYNRRGLVYEELEKWDDALADYTKTIELSPKWPIAYNNRGYVYLKQKKYVQAKADFETALKLDNSLPTPYINLAGLAWLQKKDRKQVFQYLDKALKRNFRDFESLYDDNRKGWMFDGINNTSEFRAVMYK